MASISAIRETVAGGNQINPLGTNSASFAVGDLVTVASGLATKSTTTGAIVGSALVAKTFASDNQTVAKLTLPVRAFNSGTLLTLTADADIAKTDEGTFFNLNADQTVDVATKTTYSSFIDTTSASATDATVYKQLKLVKFVAARIGEFAVVTLGNA